MTVLFLGVAPPHFSPPHLPPRGRDGSADGAPAETPPPAAAPAADDGGAGGAAATLTAALLRAAAAGAACLGLASSVPAAARCLPPANGPSADGPPSPAASSSSLKSPHMPPLPSSPLALAPAAPAPALPRFAPAPPPRSFLCARHEPPSPRSSAARIEKCSRRQSIPPTVSGVFRPPCGSRIPPTRQRSAPRLARDARGERMRRSSGARGCPTLRNSFPAGSGFPVNTNASAPPARGRRRRGRSHR